MIRRVLAVAHDASRTGAPLTLLNLIEWARLERGVETTVVALADGPLIEMFAEVAEVRVLPPALVASRRAAQALGRPPVARPVDLWLRRALAPASAVDLVLASSAASAPALAHLPEDSAPLAVHLHELSGVIEAVSGAEATASALARAAVVITPAASVAALATRAPADGGLGVPPDRVVVHPGPVDPPPRRRRAGGAHDALVVGCGSVGWRKGTDLFVALADAVGPEVAGRDVRWVWIGADSEDGASADVVDEIALRGLAGRVRLLGEVPDAVDRLAAADILAITSREDPYPLVATEAALVGTPVVGFEPGTALLADAGHDERRVRDLDVRRLAEQVRQVIAAPDTARLLTADLAHAAASATTPIVAPRIWDALERIAATGGTR